MNDWIQMHLSPNGVIDQAGVVPYRYTDERLHVLIISTSSGRNWTIPKGIIDPGETDLSTAANESWEEAGIRGTIYTPAMGQYGFRKWGCRCEVKVFAMRVTHEAPDWPEGYLRRRQWLSPVQAARMVKHAALGDLIASIEPFVESL